MQAIGRKNSAKMNKSPAMAIPTFAGGLFYDVINVEFNQLT